MLIIVAGVIGTVVGGLATGNSVGGLIATGPAVPWAIGVWTAMIFLPASCGRCGTGGGSATSPSSAAWSPASATPFFLMIGVLATWRGMARHLIGREGWTKTERVDETEPEPATHRTNPHARP